MSEQVAKGKQEFLDTFDTFCKTVIDRIDEDEGIITIKGNEIMARSSLTLRTLYDYGGYNFYEAKRSFVNYLNNTGKLEINIEEAREYYGLD